MTISVILVEEHAAVREGMKSLLDAPNGYTVVGETGDGVEAIRLITQLQPELVITGLALAKMNGIELTRQTGQLSPNTRVVVFSQDSREETILEALRAGARGYILKEDDLNEIVRAVAQVTSGHYYLSPSILSLATNALLQKEPDGAYNVYDTLTTREREVYQLTAQGFSNTEIAERLLISKRTVDVHRANLSRKLGLRTKRNQLQEYAVWAGILGNTPGMPRRSFAMLMVYYGHHSTAVDERILEARPAYLVANTAHGLWAEVSGRETVGLLEDVRALQEAGIRVLGYLTSGYGGKGSSGGLDHQWYTLETNQRLVRSMASLDGVDGVFIDECSAHPDDGEKAYYRQLASSARSHGLTVWGNAGLNDFDPWYFTDGEFDFMNSTELWDGQELTPLQRDWGRRMSVIALGPEHDLEEALRLTTEACRQGLAYCYVTTSYLQLPPWTEQLARHVHLMDVRAP